MKTLKLRIKDKHIKELNQLSGSVNFVWNYVNALSFEHLKRTGKFFSAYVLSEYTKGSGEYLGLHSQTLKLSMRLTPRPENNLKKPSLTGAATVLMPNVNHWVGNLLKNLLSSICKQGRQVRRD